METFFIHFSKTGCEHGGGVAGAMFGHGLKGLTPETMQMILDHHQMTGDFLNSHKIPGVNARERSLCAKNALVLFQSGQKINHSSFKKKKSVSISFVVFLL